MEELVKLLKLAICCALGELRVVPEYRAPAMRIPDTARTRYSQSLPPLKLIETWSSLSPTNEL